MNTCSQNKCGKTPYSVPVMQSGNGWSMENFPLAMAYVPMQHLKRIYELDEALQTGTLFPELNKPFTAWKGGRIC